MFVKPQHFQQHDRWLESLLESRVAGLRPDGWGLRALTLDEDLLKLGQIGITRCEAVCPTAAWP